MRSGINFSWLLPISQPQILNELWFLSRVTLSLGKSSFTFNCVHSFSFNEFLKSVIREQNLRDISSRFFANATHQSLPALQHLCGVSCSFDPIDWAIPTYDRPTVFRLSCWARSQNRMLHAWSRHRCSLLMPRREWLHRSLVLSLSVGTKIRPDTENHHIISS